MLTIGIPVYNRIKYLPSTIESILSQTYRNFTLNIVDDASDVCVKEVVQKYLADDRVKYVRNKTNIGLSKNFSLISESSNTDYVMVICEDDPLQDNKAFEMMVKFLDSNTELSLVAAARNVIDKNSKLIRFVSNFDHEVVFSGKRIIKRCLVSGKNLIGEPSCVIFRKSRSDRVFDAKFNQLVDLDMWFHLLERGDFGYLAQPLCSLRKHSGQMTEINKNNNVRFIDGLNLIYDYIDKDYIGFSKFDRSFVIYRTFIKLHKSLVNNLITTEEYDRIVKSFNLERMSIKYMPFYKSYKRIFKFKYREYLTI